MRMSARAEAKIREILQEEAEMIAQENYVPAIGWIFNRRGNEDDPGPTLCFFERSRVERMQPYEDTELLIYDSLPQWLADAVQGAVLDLVEGNFNFVRDGVIIRPLEV
jgi:hypothetical protein